MNSAIKDALAYIWAQFILGNTETRKYYRDGYIAIVEHLHKQERILCRTMAG